MKRFSAFLLATAFFALALIMVDTPSMAATTFKDVPDSHPHALAIAYVKDQGFVQGYEDGTFRPDATINRAEFMKIVVYAAVGQEPLEHAGQCFSDVATGDWFYSYICYAERLGYVQGYGDGSFRPTQNISFVEAAKIISNLLGEDQEDGTNTWYKPYVDFLAGVQAIPLEIESFTVEITRGEMAEMIFRLHAKKTDKSSHTFESLEAAPTDSTAELLSNMLVGNNMNGNEVTITTDANYRYITSNGLPNHEPGDFPNQGNPNSISEQSHEYRMPLNPKMASSTTEAAGPQLFGVALNGVPFDPGTAEAWNNDLSSGWNYDALSGKIDLGLDESNAHVQPDGTYHYHGIPNGIFDEIDDSKHSALVGYAADGYPVYSVLGFSNPTSVSSPIEAMHSSYQLKTGTRPNGPGGSYDGTFVQDFEYIAGTGDLDECNGRETVTPEHPDGTYAYFLTTSYPFIPRCIKGEADASFSKGGGGGAGGIAPNNGPTNGPPQAAKDACSGKTTGTSCSFSDGGRTVNGSCRSTPDGMACAP